MLAVTRRGFGRLLGAGVAAAALRPVSAEKAAATARLSANENPYGPSPAALSAMREACSRAWLYPDDDVLALRAALARLHGLTPEFILLGDGSSEILKLAASAFTGPGRKLLVAEPTFESIALHARAAGAEVAAVPLDARYAHDLSRMAAVDAGLIYICNPNNPTASVTPRLLEFLKAVDAPVLVDEAYHHYAEGPDYQSAAGLVTTRPRLIVVRTFSKIYAMAGARLGYAIAQPEVVRKLAAQAAFDTLNCVALAGAQASLADADWVALGRKRNSAVRGRLVAELAGRGYQVIPSQANFVMIHTRREVKPLIAALRDRGVDVGRFFPALPQHLRVTIGKPDQMQRFLDAFAAVTS